MTPRQKPEGLSLPTHLSRVPRMGLCRHSPFPLGPAHRDTPVGGLLSPPTPALICSEPVPGCLVHATVSMRFCRRVQPCLCAGGPGCMSCTMRRSPEHAP